MVDYYLDDKVPVRVLTVTPDYICDWAFINPDEPEKGGAVLAIGSDDDWCGEVPLPPELIRQCHDWSSEFSWAPLDENLHSQLDWVDFHRRGKALAVAIKNVLGPDVRVIYEKPFEDPSHKCDTRVEILSDGSCRPLSRLLQGKQ
ncbi:MAG: hypothetical protein RLZZ09_2743 [Pseudomonadota bacterium]